MNKEQEVLKRCPFCGSEATLERVPETMIADCTDAVVRCSNCGALGPPILYERDTGQDDPHPEAIAAWNRRSSDEQAEVVGLLGYMRAEDRERAGDTAIRQTSFWVSYTQNAYYSVPVYGSPPAVAAGGVTEERVEAAAKAIFDTWSAQTSYWPPMTWEDAQRAAAHPADFPKMARIVPLCRAEARAALLAALAEREGWQPIETAPPAMHVTACRFDHDAGEWVYAVVMSPPIYPFTHWRMLDPPPSRGEGE